MIAIASDHAGFALKQTLLAHLREKGVEVEDMGTYSEESCDYPLYGAKVGRAVAAGAAEKGVIICGTGIGISISANKIHGVRAALCADVYSAEMCRRHNDANVLALAGRILEPERALEILDVFLSTPFEGGRHQRRVDIMMQLEDEA